MLNDDFESLHKLRIDKVFIDRYFNLFLKQYFEKNKFIKKEQNNQYKKRKDEMDWKFIKHFLKKIKSFCQDELMDMYFVFETRYKVNDDLSANDLNFVRKIIFHKSSKLQKTIYNDLFDILDHKFQKISFGVYSYSDYKLNYGRDIKNNFIINIPMVLRSKSVNVKLIQAKKKFFKHGFIWILSFNLIPVECSKIIYKFIFAKKKSKKTLDPYYRFRQYQNW